MENIILFAIINAAIYIFQILHFSTKIEILRF